jgi:lipid II:glycine glycyltransferase (peptidoglycan interpeptide bridge formation enzyme)
MIRKAEREGISITHLGLSDLELFYKYYMIANTEKKLDVHPIAFFSELFTTASNISFNILAARRQDQIVGIIVTVNDKNYSIYWLGITINESGNYGQGELLQWTAIKELKDSGCKYYDLCHINESRLPQIFAFKSGFSRHEIDVFSCQQKSFFFRVLNKLNKSFR